MVCRIRLLALAVVELRRLRRRRSLVNRRTRRVARLLGEAWRPERGRFPHACPVIVLRLLRIAGLGTAAAEEVAEAVGQGHGPLLHLVVLALPT